MFPHIKCVQYIAVVIPSKMKYIYVVPGLKGLSFNYSVVIHKCFDIIAMGRKVLKKITHFQVPRDCSHVMSGSGDGEGGLPFY